MKECRYTGLECSQPHLKCEVCDVRSLAMKGLADALEYPVGFISVPDPRPYVKFVTPSGNLGIEIGIKGTF